MTSPNRGKGQGREQRWELDRSKSHVGGERERKPGEPLVCKQCGVVRHGGRWTWASRVPEDAVSALCPACTRIAARDAAGTIRVHGGELAPYHEEIANMARNQERAERAEHPLERLIEIQAADGGLVLTTTGVHLARRIANSLERRFHRQAQIRYPGEPERVLIEFPPQ